MALTLAVAALGWRYTTQVPPAYWGVGILESRVPVGPAEHLRNHPPPGAMLNAFDLGGYLLYALAPDQRVFIDGRNDTVYSDDFFRRALATSRSPTELERMVDEHDIGYAVVPFSGPGDPRYAYLHRDPRWQLVYFDDAGAVLVKRSDASAAYLDQHGFRELSLHDAFQRAATLGDSAEDSQLANEIIGQSQLHPDSLVSAYLAALVHRRLGNQPAYAWQRRLVAELAADRKLDLPLP